MQSLRAGVSDQDVQISAGWLPSAVGPTAYHLLPAFQHYFIYSTSYKIPGKSSKEIRSWTKYDILEAQFKYILFVIRSVTDP